ncbi:CPBP family intramembrane glutamic endopeptidase [Aquimarina agarilytica]|uniref:CPBP family intramembrane glutamic endopeptidase n=1 Tax=Aquimarina agarilytica TaxID=1087449 RepID=UPI000289257E|nr:CPBP family intramembrane glutamic endopeptidase [Aquimarina agarilytica]
MISTKSSRFFELLLLFFILPILLALPMVKWIKLSAVGIALLYVGFLVFSTYKFRFKKPNQPSKNFKLRVLLVSLLLFVSGIILIKLYDKSLLFQVVKQKPDLWIVILFVYTFLSVFPQEVIYRKFFYERYHHLIANKKLFFLLNVSCFALCHLFLKSIPVLIITFIGGCFFAYTYEREQSITWVSLEHALYGNLVFTLGLGEMLAFPGAR